MINTDLAFYLVVGGYGDDPAVVTTTLGLEPTATWVRGDAFSEAFPEARRPLSQWMLASGLPADAPFRDHAATLLALLEPRAEALGRLRDRYPVSIAVGLYYHTADPAFFLDEDLIARFRALGLEPHFDQLPTDDRVVAPDIDLDAPPGE